MKHKDKARLARRLSGRQTNHFDSPEWNTYAERIALQISRKEQRQKEAAKRKRGLSG